MWPVHAWVEAGDTAQPAVTCVADTAVIVKDYDKLHAFRVSTVDDEAALEAAARRYVEGSGAHHCLVVRCGGGTRNALAGHAVQVLYDVAAGEGADPMRRDERQPGLMAAAASGDHELVDVLSPQRAVHSKAAVRTGLQMLTSVEYTPEALARTFVNLDKWEEPTVAAVRLRHGGGGYFTVVTIPRPGDQVELGIALRSVRKGSTEGVADLSSRCRILPVLVHELIKGLPVDMHVVVEVNQRRPPADVLPALRFTCDLGRQTLIAPKEISPTVSVEDAAAGFAIVAADAAAPTPMARATSLPRRPIGSFSTAAGGGDYFEDAAPPPARAAAAATPARPQPADAEEDAAWAAILSNATTNNPRLGATAGSGMRRDVTSPISKLAAAIVTEDSELADEVKRPLAASGYGTSTASASRQSSFNAQRAPPSSLAKRVTVPSPRPGGRASRGTSPSRLSHRAMQGVVESIDRTLGHRQPYAEDSGASGSGIRRALDITGATEEPSRAEDGFSDFLRVWDRQAMGGVGEVSPGAELACPTPAERRGALVAEVERLRRQREQQDGRLERMQDAAVKVKEENLTVAASIRQTQTMNTKLEYEIRRMRLDYEKLQSSHASTLRLLKEESDKRKEAEHAVRVQKDREVAKLRESVGRSVRSPLRTTARERAHEAALCGELRLEIVELKKENTALRKQLAGNATARTKTKLEQHQKVLEVLHERVRRSESEVSQLELEKVSLAEQKESLGRELQQCSLSRDKLLEAVKSQPPPAETAAPSVLQSSVSFLLAATNELLARSASVLTHTEEARPHDSTATEVLVATVESIEMLDSTLKTLGGEAERSGRIAGLSKIKPAVAEEMERLSMLTDILETAQQLHTQLKPFEEAAIASQSGDPAHHPA
eukprot:TRINITY_DN25280_c0_g1_i1.p1 TRINITY_DN25280_c0_g1~~TRINITY_DN25280_c0_g1_i1.p1  ORF type:complete len:891 (+),score=279.86 TRINITY_DN25280_c0_g1_i1:64-2736(+)